MTINAWGLDGWDLEEYHCGDHPPPTFQIPPPPQPPNVLPTMADGMKIATASLNLCEDARDTCLVARELQANDILQETIHVPVFLVITTAVTLVFLMIIATGLVYRLRHWFVIAKDCQHVQTFKIYDSLASYQQSLPCRKSKRLKPTKENILGIPVSLQLCSASSHNRHHSEHLYQSVSTDSDACSYTTSEAKSCHNQVHRFNTPLLNMHNNTTTGTGDANIQLQNSPKAQSTHFTTSIPTIQSKTSDADPSHYINVPELDNVLPNLIIKNFNTNNLTTQPNLAALGTPFPVPCLSCGLSLFSNRSTRIPSHHQYSNSPRTKNVPSSHVKNSYYMRYHHSKGSSLSPEDRGLRPLPSRSPRFKANFIPDYLQQQKANEIRLKREWRTCHCDKKKCKNIRYNLPNFYFNPRYTESNGEPNTINFRATKSQNMYENKSKDQTDTVQNPGEEMALLQFSNGVSFVRSRNNQNEIEHLYENCNDA